MEQNNLQNEETEKLPELIPQYRKFLNRWFSNYYNGTEAAIYAGYPEDTASQKASHILATDKVKKHVEAHFANLAAQNEQHNHAMTQDLQNLINTDLTDFVKIKAKKDTAGKATGEHAAIIDFNLLKKSGRGKFIKEISIDRNGKLSLKLENKEAAREMLNKHRGYYEKDNNQKKRPDINFYLPDNGRDDLSQEQE